MQGDAFLETDAASEAALRGLSCGTTAVAALVLGEWLHVANAGDCRCVAATRRRRRPQPPPLEAGVSEGQPQPLEGLSADTLDAVDLTTDHRPATNDSERRRAEAAGASVASSGYLNLEIAVSRALGDWHMRSKRAAAGCAAAALIAEPEVVSVPIGDRDVAFLVLVR